MPATRRFAPPSRTMKEASVSSAVQGGELARSVRNPGGSSGVGTRSGSGAEQARSIWSVTVRQGVSGGTGCRAAKPSMGRLAWQSADDRLSVRLPSLYVSVGRRYLASRH